VAALICIFYGFAKINGSQFTIIDSELAKPLGEVSGFWLTWHYFGYSPIYGNLIAAVQIGGGILLVFPRTSLLGALVLLPVAANIVLLDIFYGIPVALPPAVIVLVCLIVILATHAARLKQVLLLDPVRGRGRAAARVAALAAVIAAAYATTWWTANYNNRAPTPIDGIWTTVADERTIPDADRWDRVFFEYNRAHMAVVRNRSGIYDVNHFEIDPEGIVRIWDQWISKGTLLMEGRREADGRIRLRPAGQAGGAAVVIERTSAGAALRTVGAGHDEH
jgi:hypothetical protein